MGLRLGVKNFAALRDVDWSLPAGLSALVGPNGSGKSTLLRMFEMLRHVVERGLPEAIAHHVGGAAHVRNYGAESTAEISLRIEVDDLSWQISPQVSSGALEPLSAERLTVAGESVLERAIGERPGRYRGKPLIQGESTLLRSFNAFMRSVDITKLGVAIEEADRVAARRLETFLCGCRFYRANTFKVYNLARYGSRDGDHKYLHVNGENLFTVLRNWKNEDPARLDFVVDALRGDAFPQFRDIKLPREGQTITCKVIDGRWSVQEVPIAQEADGLLMMMLMLSAVASTEPGGVVAIDEVETSLHPQAIRQLLDAAGRWAQSHEVRIVVATHSPVVIDYFKQTPSNLFVMEPRRAQVPLGIDELFTEEWIRQCSLGEMYSLLNFGAPV